MEDECSLQDRNENGDPAAKTTEQHRVSNMAGNAAR
jgi:hypothetical protein